jgi:hypothetical protein
MYLLLFLYLYNAVQDFISNYLKYIIIGMINLVTSDITIIKISNDKNNFVN